MPADQASPMPAAMPTSCSNPDALGVSRVVEIDTTGGPGFGFEHADQCPQLGVERTQHGRRLWAFMTQDGHCVETLRDAVRGPGLVDPLTRGRQPPRRRRYG
jgi:hypothetical protein